MEDDSLNQAEIDNMLGCVEIVPKHETIEYILNSIKDKKLVKLVSIMEEKVKKEMKLANDRMKACNQFKKMVNSLYKAK